MAEHFTPATRKKVLLPAFARALKDPFLHARVAGVKSLQACQEYFEADELATRVVPALGPCLIDPEEDVRNAAFKALTLFLQVRLLILYCHIRSTLTASPLADTSEAQRKHAGVA